MDDELKKSAPWLYQQRQKEDGFKTPEGYFDTLEDRVFERIEAAGLQRQSGIKRSKRTAKRFSLPQVLMAVAAACALVLAAICFFSPPRTIQGSIASLELSDEDIESYVLENVQDFETEQLAALPAEDENEYQVPIDKPPSKSPETFEDIKTEDLENILKDMTDEELEQIL